MFEEVYNIQGDSPAIWVFLLLAAFAGIIFLIIFTALKKTAQSTWRLKLVLIVFVASLLVPAIMIRIEYEELKDMVTNHTCEAVEGIVTEFRPKTIWGKKPESFFVNGSYFEYNDSNIGNGYNKIQGLGGVIREGLKVRICHYKGKILKLEIEKQR